jgi:dihydroorotate dehydrogenase
MSLIPYAHARPMLFGMDAEAAHDLTLDMLAKGQGTPLQWAWCQETVADPIELAGLHFPNRVGLGAGLDKNARCIDALGAMGFGFVEVGTVTPRAQPGNPKPRMFRLPQRQALINRFGPGCVFAQRTKSALSQPGPGQGRAPDAARAEHWQKRQHAD